MKDPDVPLERVRGQVRALVTSAVPPTNDPPPEPVTGEENATRHPLGLADVAPVATIGVVAVASGELVAAVMSGVAVLGALVLRRLTIVERFGFGDGFTPFRSELGWPRGVQEDDDFHWSWAGAAPSPHDEAAPAGRRSLAR
jgi:hypothetical protein